MNVLQKIVEHKRGEVEAAKARTPLAELQARLFEAPPVRDFVAALRVGAPIHLIAEIKKASPSAGLIRPDFDPVTLAKIYEQAGAHCLSVLTDEHYFQGRLEYLTAVRHAVVLPVLRKDFLIDTYQVWEARAAGADCILLIAECLDDCRMRELYFLASELEMDCLIEFYDPENLERVLKLDPKLVGVNNRSLRTMTTDLEHSLRLRSQIPSDVVFVSESGIKLRTDVERLVAAGVQGMLVGETFMKSPDISAKVHELLGT